MQNILILGYYNGHHSNKFYHMGFSIIQNFNKYKISVNRGSNLIPVTLQSQ